MGNTDQMYKSYVMVKIGGYLEGGCVVTRTVQLPEPPLVHCLRPIRN